MARFISREKAQKTQKLKGWLLGVLLIYAVRPAVAEDNLQSLLTAPSLPSYQWFASTDPQHQNQDYLTLKPGETRRIPLAAGSLLRLWSTAFKPEMIVLSLQNGERVELLREGRAKFGQVYEKAFTFYPAERDVRSVRALQSGAALLVTNRAKEPNKFFYQATVRGQNAAAAKKRFDSTSRPTTFVHEFSLAAHAEKSFDNHAQQGVIEEISILLNAATARTLRDVKLKAQWDGQSNYAVDAPLSAFSGRFFDGPLLGSAAWAQDGDSLKIKWLMPFASGARLTFVNEGSTPLDFYVSVVVRKMKSVPPFRFCAVYGAARSQKGKPISMLRVNGQGAFAGLALGIAPAADSARRTFAYLEGNETITADGKKYEGTGTEDFFNSAWYYPDKPFARPYHGMTFKNKMPPRVAAYRLMIPDAVPFQKSLSFDFEHANRNNSNDLEYRWIAFWYQKPPLKFEIFDTLKNRAQSASPGRLAEGDARLKRVVFTVLGSVLLVLVITTVARLMRRPSST